MKAIDLAREDVLAGLPVDAAMHNLRRAGLAPAAIDRIEGELLALAYRSPDPISLHPPAEALVALVVGALAVAAPLATWADDGRRGGIVVPVRWDGELLDIELVRHAAGDVECVAIHVGDVRVAIDGHTAGAGDLQVAIDRLLEVES